VGRQGRNNRPVRATTPMSADTPRLPALPTRAGRARAAALTPADALGARRALAAVGLVGVVLAALALAGSAADQPTAFVPASLHGGFPDWLAGPLHGLGLGRLSSDRFQDLVLAMSVCYAFVLLGARALSARAVALGVIAAHVAILLGPVLLSQDVFGYLSFARLGALHGLDPYTHASAAVPGDAVYRYLGWTSVSSPYGPLFTVASYVVVPLGVAGGLWALKGVAVLASLATVALVARAATRAGASPTVAAAFVGANPVLLVNAVGGFHNDTLLIALLGAALLATAGAHWGRAAVALALATGVKVSAGLIVPFLVLGPPRTAQRARTLLIAVAALVLVAGVALAGFGGHALAFAASIRGEQQQVATHSIPAETARLVGLSSAHGTPLWWRSVFVGVFAVVVLVALWRTTRGSDWRRAAAWTLLALLVSTSWLLPWYAVWLLPFAAVLEDRRLRVAVLAFCVYAVLIRLPVAAPLLNGGRG
jgi:alpha-1,6-mannosyltransferase